VQKNKYKAFSRFGYAFHDILALIIPISPLIHIMVRHST
jgi:hypothetical protein